MKQLLLIISILFMIACNGSNHKGVKFAPKERISHLTEQERKDMILKKRTVLSEINIDTLLFANNIKLTILSPKPKDEITLEVSKLAEIKMIQITSQNGISSLGTSPVFILAMTMTPISKGSTSTVPEKETGVYDINFYVGNIITKDIYSSLSSKVMGVGDSYEEAALNAVASIDNTPEFKQMLETASTRIIQWYNTNAATFKMQVEQLVASGDYEQANTLLASVPQNASKCYEYVQQKRGAVLNLLFEQRKADNLAKMKDAIAEAGTSYSTKVIGYYQMLPANSSERKIADKLYNNYMSNIELSTKNELDHQRYMEKAEVEYRALQVQAEIEASHAMMSKYQKQSGGYTQRTDNQTNEENSKTFDTILANVVNLAMNHVSTFLGLLI